MNDISGILRRVDKLNELGIALSAERNTERLLERILIGAKDLTNADGGTIYSVTPDQRLKFEMLSNTTLNIAMGGTTGKVIPFDPIPMYDPDTHEPNLTTVVTAAVLKSEAINIPDAYSADGYDFTGTRKFDEKTGYRTKSILTIPMKNHENDFIGVLQLINAQFLDEVVPFSAEDQRLAESLASQAAMALTNQRLIAELNHLFDSFIKLIATAIDEKSPYTGGHCKRVPELTMMLAQAAADSDLGSLKEFSMQEKDRYELEVAAWLHDCGKITTPESVMDKATKLECIHDRINDVETRYEVLKRDAEIARLNTYLAATNEEEKQQADALYKETIASFDEELAFLKKSNIGGEFMADDAQRRVHDIARQTIEMAGERVDLLSEDEVYNLTIQKGTLTPEEREVINNHIVATIKMLESLPFPKHLKRVPEYAGGHHEKMDGTGYPRGLTRDQMSVPARVMAIADIFEALTARDRPYKPGKKLSECLRIMGFMKKDRHIDEELFQVFVEDKLYMDYANRFLHPDQIDEVNHADIPGYESRK